MTTAIFDLDGTLADTSRDLLDAANACFPSPVLQAGRDRALAFKGGRAMLREGFGRLGRAVSEAEVEDTYPNLLTHYEGSLDRHTRLYPGVEKALDTLDRLGWRLGVCTLKPEELAEELLRRLHVRDRFHALTGADSLPYKKPDPRHLTDTIAAAGGRREHAVMVGDSPTDLHTAAAAEVPCVLVSFEPGGAVLNGLKPAALLEHYDALPGVLDDIVGPRLRGRP